MNNLQINKINSNFKLLKRDCTQIDFRGENNPAYSSDTVEISMKKHKKTGLKLLLGALVICGTIFASIKLRKSAGAELIPKSEMKNLEQIRKNFSGIFEKELSEKESEDLAKNYKKICEITDDNEFVEKLFEQIKNDYGFKNSQIKLEVQDFDSANAPGWNAAHSELGNVIRISRIDKKYADRESIFGSLFHEFKHHKQFETAIAADKLAYEDAVAHKKLKEYAREQINNNGGDKAVINWLKEQGRPILQPEFDRIEKEIGQLPKDSPLYKKGLEYIEARKNYIQESEILTNTSEYSDNILEKEAFQVGKLAKEIFNLLF